MQEAEFFELVGKSPLTPKSQAIAHFVLVKGGSLRDAAKAFGVSFQRAGAIKRGFLKQADTGLMFKKQLNCLLKEKLGLSDAVRKEIIQRMDKAKIFQYVTKQNE